MKTASKAFIFSLFIAIGLVFPKAAFAGSFSLSADQTSKTCTDQSCELEANIVATNTTGKTLYEVTFKSDDPLHMLRFQGFDGSWTTDRSKKDGTVEPGSSVGTKAIIKPTGQFNKYTPTLYIDGKTCNLNTTPPDCYYYGGSGITFTITIVAAPTPTAKPTAIPTPTAKPVVQNTPTPTKTPTPTTGAVQPTQGSTTTGASGTTTGASGTSSPQTGSGNGTNTTSPTTNGNQSSGNTTNGTTTPTPSGQQATNGNTQTPIPTSAVSNSNGDTNPIHIQTSGEDQAQKPALPYFGWLGALLSYLRGLWH